MKEYPIKIEGKFFPDMQIAINHNQDIICGGFYSSGKSFSIEGSFFLRINGQTKEIISKEFQKFGIDFITQNMSEKQESKAKKKASKGKKVELYKYHLDDIVLRNDGGAMLIGEQYYVRESSYTTTDGNGNSSTMTTTSYYYNDIIVINMASNGKIEWTKKVPKRQKTSNDGGFYSSYALSVVNDKLYFVFNDNPKNLFYKGDGEPHYFHKNPDSLVVLVALNSKGEQTREALFTAEETSVLARPLVCEQISENEMVLFGQGRKINRFAKVVFK